MIVCEGVFMRHADTKEIIFCEYLRYLREILRHELPQIIHEFFTTRRNNGNHFLQMSALSA